MIRVLTHNTHVPYLFQISKLPETFFEVFSLRFRGRDWQNIYRPRPSNLVHIPVDHQELLPNYVSMLPFDVIIIQDFDFMNFIIDQKNPLYEKLLPIRKIFLFHNSSFTELGGDPNSQQKIHELRQIFVQNNIQPVAISEWKAASWGGNMPVIRPGIDTLDFPNSWTGKNNIYKFSDKYPEYSLRVCSNFERRDFMNGYRVSNMILSRIPNPAIILGENPPAKENIQQNVWSISQSFEHYRVILQNARFLLTTNQAQFEDFYNLSSLEACAIGCPIIFTQHERMSMFPDFSKFFPLTSDNPEYLISEANKLLNDLDYARSISEKQRGFIEKYFSLSAFAENWKRIIEGK